MRDQTSEFVAPKERKPRPWLSRLLWAVGALVVLGLLALLALRFAATTEFGRSFVETRIEAADISGQRIDIDGLSGDLMGELTIETLTISDAEGEWLIAQDLRAEWKPFALRRRALLIEQIDASTIDVLRRPSIQSRPSTGGSQQLPIRLGELKQLTVGQLNLEDGVLPRPLVLSIDANAVVSAERAALRAAVLPIGEGDKLIADLTWTPADLLQGNVTLSGPPGGLLAELGRLAPGDGLEAQLEAGGNGDTWTANLQASTSQGPLVSAKARQANEIITFSSTAYLRQHPFTAAFADWAGETTQVSGEANFDGEKPVADVSLLADSFSLAATVTGGVNGAVLADLRAEAKRPHRLMPSLPATAERLIIDGRVSYSGGQAQFSGDVAADDIAQGPNTLASLSGPASVTYRDQTLVVTAALTGKRLRLGDVSSSWTGPAPKLQLAGVYDVRRKAVMIERARIVSPALTASAKGRAAFTAPVTADLDGQLSFEGAAAGLARPLRAYGRWSAKTAAGKSIALRFDGDASGFGDLPAPLSDWLGSSAQIAARGRVEPSGAIVISSLTANSGSASLTGNAQRSASGALAASAGFSVGETSISSISAPKIDGTLRASGSPEDVSFQASLFSLQLSVQDQILSDLTAEIDGRYSAQQLVADVAAQGNSATGPFRLDTNATLINNAWSLTGTEARWAELELSGDLSGEGVDLSSIRANVVAEGIVPGDLPLERIDLSAQILDSALDVTGSLTGIAAGPLVDVDLAIDVNGSPQSATYRVSALGPTELLGLTRALSVKLEGTVTDVLMNTRVGTATLKGKLGDLDFETRRTSQIAQTPSGLVGDVALRALGGDIDLRVSDDPRSRAQLDLGNLDLAQILSLIGRMPRQGTVSANASLVAAGDRLEGDMSGEVSGLRLPSGKLSDLSLGVTGRLAEEQLTLLADADDTNGLTGRAKLTVPVKSNAATLMIMPDNDRPQPFSIDVEGPVEELADLFAPPQFLIAGDLNVDIQGALPLDAGGPSGFLRLSNGSFEHDAGLVLNRIDLQVALAAQRLSLSSFAARGRDGGSLSGSGTMSLIDGSSDLEIVADNLVVVSRREGRATTSGTLNLSRTSDLVSLTGDLAIIDGSINIDKLPSGGPVTLNVEFETTDTSVEAASSPLTSLDIKLRAPRSIAVKGSGVDAEVNLDASIKGTFSNPVIAGTSQIVRGRFELLGKRFEFRDSSIRVDGDPMDAVLDITAERNTQTLTAIVKITGTPSRLVVDLQSTPEYPEDEILSRVLFGRSPSQLSAIETAQLAGALAQLAGGSGLDLLGGLQDALGLDTLDLGQAENGGFEVATGKYLADNIYLEVRTGATGTPGVAIEWQPLDNIEVEAETTATEGQSLTVQWTTDFD